MHSSISRASHAGSIDISRTRPDVSQSMNTHDSPYARHDARARNDPAASDAGTPARGRSIILATLWYDEPGNGVAVVLRALAAALRDAGCAVVVLNLAPDGWLPRTRIGASGETVVSLCIRAYRDDASLPHRVGRFLHNALAARFITRIVRRFHVDVAHLHFAAPEYAELSAMLRRLGVPVVVTFHGSDLAVSMRAEHVARSMRRVIRGAAVLTTVSSALAAAARHAFPERAGEVRVIHNFVPSDLALAARATDGSAARDVDVMFVGSLVPAKGVDVLLRAFHDVAKRREGARLLVIGDGPERGSSERLAVELGIGAAVEFAGVRAREELATLYARARLLVLPSRSEGFGLVLAEAAAFGTPAVGADVGGIPDVIQDGVSGLIVPPDDVPALADAIATLLGDDARRAAMGAAARTVALERFSREAITRQYLEAYDRALRVSTPSQSPP